MSICQECDGKGFREGDGFSEDTETCEACGGSGIVGNEAVAD